jgi:hypothetical protein
VGVLGWQLIWIGVVAVTVEPWRAVDVEIKFLEDRG